MWTPLFMRWFKMRVCKVSLPVRDGVGWRRDLPLEGSGAGLPTGTHVPLGWALRFLGACLCKWFRHVKFQFKYFFNSLSWSAPYLFIWGQTQLPGAMTCATSNSLQIPGSPIFEELTHFFFFLNSSSKKWMAGLVYSRGISGQIYIHAPSFDTCGV